MKCFFYPDRPVGHVINSLMGELAWTVTKDIGEADLCFWWKFTSEEEELPEILEDKVCVNCGCTSTLKTGVERRFVEAFGVTTLVDPLTYIGTVVEKNNENATHECEILECPIKKTKEGKVYQRFLGDRHYIYNLRVPIICGEVPYVIIQRKNDLFRGIIHGGVDSSVVVDATEVFSDDWLERLKNFCCGYIDIADLDVVDNCILDVNNVPSNATYVNMSNDKWCKEKYAKLIKKHYG